MSQYVDVRTIQSDASWTDIGGSNILIFLYQIMDLTCLSPIDQAKLSWVWYMLRRMPDQSLMIYAIVRSHYGDEVTQAFFRTYVSYMEGLPNAPQHLRL